MEFKVQYKIKDKIIFPALQNTAFSGKNGLRHSVATEQKTAEALKRASAAVCFMIKGIRNYCGLKGVKTVFV